MAYATVADVVKGFRPLDADEMVICEELLEECDILLDSVAPNADLDRLRLCEIRMVRRALGTGDGVAVPMGATQGSMSALGYSQSWTLTNGASGELYIGKTEKILLRIGNKIGVSNPYGVVRKCSKE